MYQPSRQMDAHTTEPVNLEAMTSKERKAWYKAYQQARHTELQKVNKALNSLTPQQRLDLFDAAKNGNTITLRPNTPLSLSQTGAPKRTPNIVLTPQQQQMVAAAKAKVRGLNGAKSHKEPLTEEKEYIAQTPTPLTEPEVKPSPTIAITETMSEIPGVSQDVTAEPPIEKETQAQRRARLRQERIEAYQRRGKEIIVEKEFLHPAQRNTQWGRRSDVNSDLQEAL